MTALGAELVAALATPEGRAALGIEAFAAKLHELEAKIDAIAERCDELLPLGKILGISTKAAMARLERDSGLRAVGVRFGRRTLFTREAVRSYFATKARRQ